jgi:putative SOS response-associated peptidase YedK
MCSRFWGAPGGVRVDTAFELDLGLERPDIPLNPNTAPTEAAGVVQVRDGKRVLTPMKWGFTPSSGIVINARSETVLQRSLFKDAAEHRRCLVPANGFFEWESRSKPKQPWCFRRNDGEPMALAGLWRESQGVEQFVLLTCEPNEHVAQLHDRMASVILPEDYELWLEGDIEDALTAARIPYPDELMTSYPVTTAMSNPRYKNDDATEPIRDLFG